MLSETVRHQTKSNNNKQSVGLTQSRVKASFSSNCSTSSVTVLHKKRDHGHTPLVSKDQDPLDAAVTQRLTSWHIGIFFPGAALR